MSNSTQNTTCTEGATFDVIPSDFSETMRSNSPEKAKIMSDAYDRGLEKQEALGIPEWDENMQEAYDRGYKKGLADARKEVMGKVKKPLSFPINTFAAPSVFVYPEELPRKTLSIPIVLYEPAVVPRKTFENPTVFLVPERYPIKILFIPSVFP